MVQLLNDTVNLTIYIKFFTHKKDTGCLNAFIPTFAYHFLKKFLFFSFGIHDDIVQPDIAFSF